MSINLKEKVTLDKSAYIETDKNGILLKKGQTLGILKESEDFPVAFKELMDNYDTYKIKWIDTHGTEIGFDEWFNSQVQDSKVLKESIYIPDYNTAKISGGKVSKDIDYSLYFMQALGADTLGKYLSMSPINVYNWANKHNVWLQRSGIYLKNNIEILKDAIKSDSLGNLDTDYLYTIVHKSLKESIKFKTPQHLQHAYDVLTVNEDGTLYTEKGEFLGRWDRDAGFILIEDYIERLEKHGFVKLNESVKSLKQV